jgi:multicomponent K+:H+ antiporter subunit C
VESVIGATVSVEALVAAALGALVASGIYLVLRARIYPVILGLTLLSYAANLFLFSMGRLRRNAAPVGETIKKASGGPEQAAKLVPGLADPLPQALVLTAIVIGFGMTAFIAALAVKGVGTLGTDHVDGKGGS